MPKLTSAACIYLNLLRLQHKLFIFIILTINSCDRSLGSSAPPSLGKHSQIFVWWKIASLLLLSYCWMWSTDHRRWSCGQKERGMSGRFRSVPLLVFCNLCFWGQDILSFHAASRQESLIVHISFLSLICKLFVPLCSVFFLSACCLYVWPSGFLVVNYY